MSVFGRHFRIEAIDDSVLEKNAWFRDLISSWLPAGDALQRIEKKDDAGSLRVAVRNKYLNFYHCGQSLAKVSFGANGALQASIHNKYIYGKAGSGQAYVRLTSEGLIDPTTREARPYGGPKELRDWLGNAKRYVGDEKLFVDRAVAQNANTIDLEMALPAFGPEDRTAPRMDLVVLENDGHESTIVFWEAKLISDSRIRCKGDAAPEVNDQLEKYSLWLEYPGHIDCVTRAYQNTCRVLLALHKVAKRLNPNISELGPAIASVGSADGRTPKLDPQPRLLIYDHSGRDRSFVENKHLEKLRTSCGLHVQIVRRQDELKLDNYCESLLDPPPRFTLIS